MVREGDALLSKMTSIVFKLAFEGLLRPQNLVWVVCNEELSIAVVIWPWEGEIRLWLQ